jgi:sulfide:quinone oxidoreductase
MRVGRVVVPKPLRDALGLTAGPTVDISRYGTGLHLNPAGRTARLTDESGVLVATGETVIDDDTVFGLIDRPLACRDVLGAHPFVDKPRASDADADVLAGAAVNYGAGLASPSDGSTSWLSFNAMSMDASAPRSLSSPAATASPVLPRVVVVGGGVGALEGVLGLRAELGAQVDIDLVAPGPDFVYQPLAVAEPFGLGLARRLPLADFAKGRARLHVDRLASVDVERRVVVLESGASLPYDALLVAVGARPQEWLQGALHFGGTSSSEDFGHLLSQLRDAVVRRIAFVAPPATSWTLALYELALLTAGYAADHHLTEVELTVVTPEDEPLEVFGPAASAAIEGLMADRGIALRTGRYAGDFEWATLPLHPSGVVHTDRLVSLPRLVGWRIPGLPADAEGFIPVDDHGAVLGAPGVYAAGDGTAFPVKQGGLASQQADAATESIAALLGAPLSPAPFRPLLRGVVLTGLTPTYLRTSIDPRADEPSRVSARPLWWPPLKIAGRHLAPLLAEKGRLISDTLADRHPEPVDSAEVEANNSEARDLARAFAEEDAKRGELASALLWLEVIERIYGVLPAEDAERRGRWEREARRPG